MQACVPFCGCLFSVFYVIYNDMCHVLCLIICLQLIFRDCKFKDSSLFLAGLMWRNVLIMYATRHFS